MSSYRYSPPLMPATQTLQDMVIFYATAEIRRLLILREPGLEEAEDAWEQVMARARELLENWRPTIPYQVEMICKTGRTVDYLVWRATMELDPETKREWEHDAIHPWACDIETLPVYPQGRAWMPAMWVLPAAPDSLSDDFVRPYSP